MTQLGASWPVVGRDAELDRLRRWLLDAESFDRPAVAVVEGELGVGKTRLLAEIADRARARGFTVCGGDVSRQRVVRLARSGRVLLIVDDVPRAGQATIDLVTSLVGDPRVARVVVLLACRTGGLPVVLNRALQGVRWLRLPNLSAADVDRLLGTEPAARRHALFRASGGNPRYLEILATAPDESLVELANPTVLHDEQVGIALDRVITSELRALDEIQRSVVHAAAVLGAEVDLELVAEVAQLTGVAVAGAIDELVSAGYLCDGAGRLAFVHPLVRAAAYRLAGPGARLLTHQNAVECLRRRGASVTRQAHHLEHAAQPGDTAAADVLATAARTVHGLAPATSVRWLRVALRVLPQRPDLVDLRSSLRVRLATALVASGQLTQARAELSDLRGLTGSARTAAVRLSATIARLLGDLPAARGLAKAELHRAGTPDCRPGLHFELLLAELLAGRRPAHANGPVVAAARHPGLHAAAASLHTLSAAPGGELAELLERLRSAAELVDGLDDGTLSDVLEVTVPLGWVELLVDRTVDALRHVDRGIALAHRNGQRHVAAQLYPVQVLAHCRNGAIAESLRAADSAVAAASSIGSTEMLTFARLVRLRPLWLREGAAAASHAATEVAAAPRLGSAWHRLVADAGAAEVLLAVDRVDECLARLRPWLGTGSATVSALTPGRYALVGQAYLAAGDVAGARTWLDRAAAHVADTPLAGQLGEVAAAEAAVLLAECRVAAAEARARAAAEHFASVGFVVRAAQARMTLAEAQWRGGQLAEARRELGHARAALADAGADSLAECAARAQSRLGARLPRPTQQDLTTREREIADLIAHGMTNRAIAATLYLSPRTVDAHVRRILAKLGVPTRAAIVRHLTDATPWPAPRVRNYKTS